MHLHYLIAGSPQGGVLSPTLWNIGYNPILEKLQKKGYCFSCFANDTLVFLTASTENELQSKFEEFMNFFVEELREIGLHPNTSKTEILTYIKCRKAKLGDFWKDPKLKFRSTWIPILDKIKLNIWA